MQQCDSQQHYVEWDKSDSKEYILYDSTRFKNR